MDIPGMYLNADIRKEVLMSIEPRLAEILVAMHLEVMRSTCVMIRLKKRLYRFAKSAKLWNEKLISDLKTLDFKQNPEEPYALNKYVNHSMWMISIVLMH
jgi:hypothetical protein